MMAGCRGIEQSQIHDGQDVSSPGTDGVQPAPGREATKPIVAVLPFTNLGGDPLQEHLADGLSEDIITILAKHRSLVVIARNSVFAFKGRAGDVRQAGAELGADYVVEGSVRRLGDDLRVTAHLIQTASGQLIWADRFDRPMEALFEMQDEITNTIVASIEPQIGSVERAVAARRKPSSLQAWDLMQLGISHLYRANLKDNLEAQRLLKSACDQDPGLAQAHAHLAYATLLSMLYFDAEPEEPALPKPRNGHAERWNWTIRTPWSGSSTGGCFWHGAATPMRCWNSNSRWCSTRPWRSAIAAWATRWPMKAATARRFPTSSARSNSARTIRSAGPFMPTARSAHLFARQFRLAADWARKATHIPNCHYWPYAHRVAALGHLGEEDECVSALEALLAKRPDFNRRMARERLFYIKDPDQSKECDR
jgi:adenylate cyclase